MSDKEHGAEAEQNRELTQNKTRNGRGNWVWFYFLPFYLSTFLPFFTGCKKAKTAALPPEPETKIDYGVFYTDGPSSKKWVALTFDDGPKPEVLDKIFDTLKKENVKATFFIVGMNVKLYPQYVKKYLESGHEIGNHTYSHRNYYQLKEKMSIKDMEKILSQELDDCESAIKNAGGVKPIFMRMPNGFISPTVKKVAKEKKYVVVNWTFGCDWHKNAKEELVKKYLRSVESGAILIFHEKKITADALPEIIGGIKKKGYEIVPLRKILDLPSQQ